MTELLCPLNLTNSVVSKFCTRTILIVANTSWKLQQSIKYVYQ